MLLPRALPFTWLDPNIGSVIHLQVLPASHWLERAGILGTAIGQIATRRVPCGMFSSWFNKAKATSVAQLVDGKTATLRGTVRVGVGRVKAPLSARDTSYYLIAVEGTEPPFTEADGLPFFLTVGTDTIAVDPRGTIPVFHDRHANAYHADHLAVMQFEASRHYRRSRGLVADLALFREWRLEDGVQLEISGAVFRNVQAAQQQQGSYRDSATQWLLRATTTAPLTMRWR